jgi:hypothetical protein
VSYRTTTATNRRRRFPWPEGSTAMAAFAFWGLVVPESPLYVSLKAPLLPIIVGLLSVGGAFLISTVFKPLLDRPVVVAGQPPAQAPPP